MCLSEHDILAFTDGSLPPEQLPRIDAHLAGCALCAQLVIETLRALETGPEGWSDGSPSLRVFGPATLVASRFVIQRFLGRGGMGEVYEAWDRRSERVVALKTVRVSRSDDSQERLRLLSEVHLARKVDHPNVCRVHGSVVHIGAVAESGPVVHDRSRNPEKTLVAVMDFIDGDTLGHRVRRSGPLPVAEVRAIARDVLLGLTAIHAAGIAHLDIKSDNIMLPHARRPIATVIDFGLARPLLRCQTLQNGDSFACGTACYMAPEQVCGHALGPFTDIFALAVVLFESVTGTLPGRAQATQSSPHIPPAALPLHPAQLVRDLPPAMDAFIAKCSSVDARDRYSTAQVALACLDAI